MAATKFTPVVREYFLLIFAETGNLAASAREVGVGTQTVRNRRKTDEQFSKLYDLAYDDGTDSLEAEALRRARDGIEKNIYYKGAIVDTIREFSDSLLQFLLRGRNPERYGLKQQLTLDAANIPPARVRNDDDRKRLLHLVQTGESA